MEISILISIFSTLFITVDPLGLVPIFVIYISRHNPSERRKIIYKTIIIAAIVSVFFIFIGRYILVYLGISSGAFLIAGGILLFLISIDLILAKPSRTKLSSKDKADFAKEDISVFPLAIPMISGPGTIAALIMFSSQANENLFMLLAISVISIIVLLITMLIMFLSTGINSFLGNTGISVIQRVMGLILSALAVQFIINGLGQAGLI